MRPARCQQIGQHLADPPFVHGGHQRVRGVERERAARLGRGGVREASRTSAARSVRTGPGRSGGPAGPGPAGRTSVFIGGPPPRCGACVGQRAGAEAPAGTARRSPGWWSAGWAARGRRPRRTRGPGLGAAAGPNACSIRSSIMLIAPAGPAVRAPAAPGIRASRSPRADARARCRPSGPAAAGPGRSATPSSASTGAARPPVISERTRVRTAEWTSLAGTMTIRPCAGAGHGPQARRNERVPAFGHGRRARRRALRTSATAGQGPGSR